MSRSDVERAYRRGSGNFVTFTRLLIEYNIMNYPESDGNDERMAAVNILLPVDTSQQTTVLLNELTPEGT
jgi:hypothetical protein